MNIIERDFRGFDLNLLPLEVALMPQIMLQLSKIAPGVGLISRSTDAPRVVGMLDSSEIEIALGVFPDHPSWQRRRDLFRWRRDALGLEVRPLPFPVPEFQVSLLWTAANEADAGLRWLRSSLADVFSLSASPR